MIQYQVTLHYQYVSQCASELQTAVTLFIQKKKNLEFTDKYVLLALIATFTKMSQFRPKSKASVAIANQ